MKHYEGFVLNNTDAIVHFSLFPVDSSFMSLYQDQFYSLWHIIQDVSLDDDTLLGHIKFADNQQANITSSLSSIQQAVVLNEWFVISLGELLNYQYSIDSIHHKWTNPVHRLTTEQMEAYLDVSLGYQCIMFIFFTNM